MDDDAPKKRGRPRKKKPVEDVEALSAQDPKITVYSQDDLTKVQALIKDALKDVLSAEGLKKRDSDIAIEAMISTCAEFMKSFIIMGYDMEDNAISPIFYAKTDLEADALSHYMQQYFVASMKDMR